MQKQLFPIEITELSTEKLIKRHSRRSHIIYWILLAAFTALAISLFFISVDVNVQSRGIITTNERSASITIPVYGRVAWINVTENSYVEKGDLLLLVDTIEVNRNLRLTKEKIMQLQSFISDLEIVTHMSGYKKMPQSPALQSARYEQEVNKYFSDLNYQQCEIDILKKEYDRDAKLYKNEVISTAEYEQSAYKHENSVLKYRQLISSQLSAWQSELENYKTQYISLNQNLIDQERELGKYIITAPFEGHIQGLSGISEGSTVFSGEEIATLVPGTELIAETYISTADIGMLYNGQQARLRIDAYEANTWGFVEVVIKEIANDVSMYNGQIQGFRVVCTIHSDSLAYGHKTVKIKKGMSFTANFILMKRTLAQLLYDKISDWMNPNVIEISSE